MIQPVLTGCQSQNPPEAALGESCTPTRQSEKPPALESECLVLPDPSLGMGQPENHRTILGWKRPLSRWSPIIKAALPSPSLLTLLPSSSLSRTCRIGTPEQGGAGRNWLCWKPMRGSHHPPFVVTTPHLHSHCLFFRKKSAFKTPCQPTNYIETGKHITAAGLPCSPPWAYLQPGSGPAPSQQVPRTEAGRLMETPAPSGWPGQHPPAWAGASTGAPAPLQQPLCHSCRSKEIFPPAA